MVIARKSRYNRLFWPFIPTHQVLYHLLHETSYRFGLSAPVEAREGSIFLRVCRRDKVKYGSLTYSYWVWPPTEKARYFRVMTHSNQMNMNNQQNLRNAFSSLPRKSPPPPLPNQMVQFCYQCVIVGRRDCSSYEAVFDAMPLHIVCPCTSGIDRGGAGG